jgi:ethanolamine ammonia-lyase small subunit
MKVFRIAAVFVLLAGPAHAQVSTPSVNLLGDLPSKTPEEKEQDAIKEKAYRDSLKKIPDAKAADPWGTVRSETPAKAAAKTAPAKPKTKTGSSVN